MSEAVVLGSREWFESQKRLQESELLKKAAADWEGAMRCIIEADDDQAFQDTPPKTGQGHPGDAQPLSPEERLKYKDTGLGQLAESWPFLDMDPEALTQPHSRIK